MDSSGRIYGEESKEEMKNILDQARGQGKKVIELDAAKLKQIEGMNRKQRRDHARRNGWFKKGGIR